MRDDLHVLALLAVGILGGIPLAAVALFLAVKAWDFLEWFFG